MDHGISNEEKATSSLGGEDKRTVTIIREEVYLAMRRATAAGSSFRRLSVGLAKWFRRLQGRTARGQGASGDRAF
jgi:hypothetical protein